jgi:hypothetical protein
VRTHTNILFSTGLPDLSSKIGGFSKISRLPVHNPHIPRKGLEGREAFFALRAKNGAGQPNGCLGGTPESPVSGTKGRKCAQITGKNWYNAALTANIAFIFTSWGKKIYNPGYQHT